MKIKYLVIGAGISGLTFANYLNSEDYLILEKENSPGGYCKTIYKDEFIWDYAGHFFHFKNDETKKYFDLFLNNDSFISRIKNTKISFKDLLIDYPFQCNIHQLAKEDFIDCLYELHFKENKENYDSFQDMLYGKFGKGICDKFLIPYNEKLYACNLNKLDSNAMGRFFPYADMNTIIKNMKVNKINSYNDSFIYPKKGAQTVINYLSEGINKQKIRMNSSLERLDIKNKIAYTNLGEKFDYEYLINTSPLNEFIQKTRYSEYIKEMSWNQVLVLNMGFDKGSLDNSWDWIYIPDKGINFYRVGFYNNILGSDKLSIYVEIGFPKLAIINIDDEIRITLENLKNIGIINDHQLIAIKPIIMNPAYVHISSKFNEIKHTLFQLLQKEGIYSIGRYGAWTYCSMEDCFIEAMSLAKNCIN